MVRLAFFLLAAAVLFAPAFARAKYTKDNAPGLLQAIRKTAAQDSYSFHVQEKPSAGTDKGVKGTYQKGQPLYLEADAVEMYRKGDALVYRDGGRWLRSKTGVQSDPLRILATTAKVRAARLPHEDLAELGKSLKEVRPADKDEGDRAYSATLDRAAAQKLARSEHRPVAQGGRARVWVSAEGLVRKYEIVLELKGQLGNAQIDSSTTRTVSIRQAGKVKVEVPEEAGKALR
jgi:hypothetical protein